MKGHHSTLDVTGASFIMNPELWNERDVEMRSQGLCPDDSDTINLV